VVKHATYATINNEMVKHIADTKPENIEIEIPYNGTSVTVQLYRAEIFAPGFHVKTDRQSSVPYEKGAYYRGIIKGNRNSLASFNFFKEEMNGMISSADLNNLVVDRLRNENNMTDYIVYSDSQLLIANKFNCSTGDPERFNPKSNDQNATDSTNDFDNIYAVKIYFELDYQLFVENNGNLAQAGNWITSVFNNIQTLYANDNISVSLSDYMVHTSVDPYVNNTTSDQNLNQFFANTYIEPDSIGQLIGIDPGGQGGLAFLRGLCGLNASYCDVDLEFEDVPVYSWTVQAMTHEIGHQLGSPHTHACAWNGNNTQIDSCGAQAGYPEGNCGDGPIPWDEQGTIMSYCHLMPGVGINLQNGFGDQPRELIIDFINSRDCLEPLSTNENVFADFSYYPNPSNGIVNLTSGSNDIDEVSVYNISGQLLFSKKINATEAAIDLSAFSDGVYFFKAISGAKEMNFRIVKQ
jgi:hypothetical protein